MRETFPVVPATVGIARRLATAYAREHGASDGVTADVALAVSEALTNAVLHSGADDDPDGLELLLACDGGELTIGVRDHGAGLRPRVDSPGAGLGLPIIAGLAQRLEISRPPGGGTEVRMVFALTG